MNPDAARALAWQDACWAIDALRVDPVGLGGIRLRAAHGPVREHWLQRLQAQHARLVRVPIQSDDAALLGGLDLAATLQIGQMRWHHGLLAQAHDGCLLLPMAERAPRTLTARLAQTMDARRVTSPNGQAQDCAFALVALDEADADETGLHTHLASRLGLWLDLHPLDIALLQTRDDAPPLNLHEARHALSDLHPDEATLTTLTQVAAQWGVHDVRAVQFAWRVIAVHAAMQGRTHVLEEDWHRAIRCVFWPRATQIPQSDAQTDAQADSSPEAQTPPPEPPDPSPSNATNDTTGTQPPPDAAPPEPPPNESLNHAPHTSPPDTQPPDTPPPEMLIAASLAALPDHVLDQLMMRHSARASKQAHQGQSGSAQRNHQRGRPLPSRAGRPNERARLDVLATLRHAAPRQAIRAASLHGTARLRLRADDFHTRRYAQKSASCLILALDASGSAAMQRLAQAKAAVELLLAQSYARRDSVCVIGFRGAHAQCLLPPTRSLVRAKRALSGLPGGGGTPLASALRLSLSQALQLQRDGQTPLLVVLSDGRANVTLAGLGGRQQAQTEASAWGKRWAETGLAALWIDTAMQPEPLAQALAQDMRANYLPMPHLQAERLASALSRHIQP